MYDTNLRKRFPVVMIPVGFFFVSTDAVDEAVQVVPQKVKVVLYIIVVR